MELDSFISFVFYFFGTAIVLSFALLSFLFALFSLLDNFFHVNYFPKFRSFVSKYLSVFYITFFLCFLISCVWRCFQ